MTRSLNETAFRRVYYLTAFQGESCLRESCGPPIGVAKAAAWNGREGRIPRVPPEHLKDRKGHGISDAKIGVFGIAPVSQPRVKRGGEQAGFWQVQQSPRPRTQLHARSDRGGRTRSGDRDGSGPEGAERDFGARNHAAHGSPFFELRSCRIERPDSHL